MTNRLAKLFNEIYIYAVTIREVIEDTKKAKIWARSNKSVKEMILKDKDRLIADEPKLSPVLSYIQNNAGISVFNSDFELKYTEKKEIMYDQKRKLKFVMHNGKALYYPRLWRSSKISEMYNSVCCEQDDLSPHRYLDEGETLDNYIVFDCGSAEANLALDVIEKAKAVYLFEGDECWNQPLKATFSSFIDKVTIVNDFIGKKDEHVISLREYIEQLVSDNKVDLSKDKIFIKMDIEGHELEVFEDLLPIMDKAEHLELAVCVYHNQQDEKIVLNMIPKGYTARLREGYMLFLWEGKTAEYPYFRHGIMRIKKED